MQTWEVGMNVTAVATGSLLEAFDLGRLEAHFPMGSERMLLDFGWIGGPAGTYTPPH